MRTGPPLVKVAVAVLARWALLKYTRPPGLPKEKVFCGAGFSLREGRLKPAPQIRRELCSETAVEQAPKTEALHLDV